MGGTSGIGKAVAELLLAGQWKVAISGIPVDDLSVISANYKDQVLVKYIDCSKENFSDELSALVSELGGMDLFIFSSGVGHLNKDIGFAAENPANKVNVLGFTEALDWAYRFFQEQKHGHLVGVTSMAGMFGFRTSPAYTAAKGYQINYIEALIQKANKSDHPIYVTEVRPGFVDTEISKDLKRFWVASPQKAAKQIVAGIRRKRKIIYVTKRWRLMALVVELIPRFVRRRL